MTHTCGAKVWLVIPRKSVHADRRLSHCNNCKCKLPARRGIRLHRRQFRDSPHDHQVGVGNTIPNCPRRCHHGHASGVLYCPSRFPRHGHANGIENLPNGSSLALLRSVFEKRPQTQVWHRVRVPPASPAPFFFRQGQVGICFFENSLSLLSLTLSPTTRPPSNLRTRASTVFLDMPRTVRQSES